MAKLASGKKSVAISDRSGFKIKYTDLKTTWDGLRVEPSEWEPKHPQLTPAKNVVDATALFQPRPDNDPENVDIFFGYTQNIFASRVERSQTGIGIKGKGAIGYLGLIIDAAKTVSGEAGTGAIGAPTLFITLDVSVTGVNGTGATGTETFEQEANPSGEAGTGAIGVFVPESQITESGVAGTGAIGTLTSELEVNEIGVAGTGAVGFTNETGNGNVQLQVTGLSGLGATGNVGEEVGVSEAIETGLAGTGAIGTFTLEVNKAWGEGAWSEGSWGE
jgi:hypothetical protein